MEPVQGIRNDFSHKLLNSIIEALTEEYKYIVEKHKKEIDQEFDMAVARRITDLSIYISEKLDIYDLGRTIKIEIRKSSK